MYSIANPEGGNQLTAAQAVVFFQKSGLPNQKLGEVWNIAAQTSNDFLTRDEFYVALRIIAYMQSGKRADAEAIRLEIEAPLPNFDGGEPVGTARSSFA